MTKQTYLTQLLLTPIENILVNAQLEGERLRKKVAPGEHANFARNFLSNCLMSSSPIVCVTIHRFALAWTSLRRFYYPVKAISM